MPPYLRDISWVDASNLLLAMLHSIKVDKLRLLSPQLHAPVCFIECFRDGITEQLCDLFQSPPVCLGKAVRLLSVILSVPRLI